VLTIPVLDCTLFIPFCFGGSVEAFCLISLSPSSPSMPGNTRLIPSIRKALLGGSRLPQTDQERKWLAGRKERDANPGRPKSVEQIAHDRLQATARRAQEAQGLPSGRAPVALNAALEDPPRILSHMARPRDILGYTPQFYGPLSADPRQDESVVKVEAPQWDVKVVAPRSIAADPSPSFARTVFGAEAADDKQMSSRGSVQDQAVPIKRERSKPPCPEPVSAAFQNEGKDSHKRPMHTAPQWVTRKRARTS